MSDRTATARSKSTPGLKLSPRNVVILFAAVVLYLLLRPSLSDWLGMPLPGLFPEQPAVVQPAPAPEASPPIRLPVEPRPPVAAGAPAADQSVASSRPVAESSRSGRPTPVDPPVVSAPQTNREIPPEREPPTVAARPPPQARPKPTPAPAPRPATVPAETGNPQLGQLTDLGGQRFRSTAGLIYEPLRSEHRIEHVLRHSEDDPSKPVHGVFSGGRETILALIDEAYQLAQKGRPPKVEIEDEGDRTVYVVDLGRKIGFMGGQSGARKRFPPCRHLQLVLEDRDVITAYPVIPR